jgi:hypothetical protein|tara:strand:+ start:9 stop:713 length:705 start_codon:yes stop_codon:yes gene_type:complete
MYLVNVSIDDVSPHPRSSTKVLERCRELINVYPDIKFTLFIPAAYWRTKSQTTEKPLHLNQFPDFCKEIKDLDKNNFEIGYHGFYHGIPNISNNDEFRYASYEQTVDIIKKTKEITTKTNINFKNILRPPAWRMTGESIKACKDQGIEILALSSDKYPDGSLDYQGEDKNFKNVVYYNCCPPLKRLELFPKTEIVYHACEWDQNYLNKEKTNQLKNFLDTEDIKFCFMEDMLNG